jgi:hypothetical protein
MKPKTKIQKEVARLSANLRPISATQIDWAYRHCVEHIGYRTKKGNITCSDCGHEWHSDSGLCDTLEGCTCPKCHAELKVQDTRRRIYKETQNFSVITTCKPQQRKYDCFRSDGTCSAGWQQSFFPVCPAVCGRLFHSWGRLTHSAFTFRFRQKRQRKKKNHLKTRKSTSWHRRKRKGHCFICLNIV